MMTMLHRAGCVFAAGMVVFAASAASAEEHSYFKGNTWEVILNEPDSEADGPPFCAKRTLAWGGKSVSFETALVGLDAYDVSMRLRKAGWQLPAGATTKVSVSNSYFTSQIMAKAVSPDELAVSLQALSAVDQLLMTSILNTPFKPSVGTPLTVYFEGDEPQWTIPIVDEIEAYQVTQASNECESDLTAMGPTLYGRGENGEASKTSPFRQSDATNAATKLSAPQPTFRSPPATPEAMPSSPAPAPADHLTLPTLQASPDTPETQHDESNNVTSSGWRFTTEDEDWGKTCFADTQVGEAKIGFMGSPGKELVAFVERGFSGKVRATWRVDDLSPYVLDGDQDDYFGWHSFYDVPAQLISDLSKGKSLAITSSDGTRIVVGLQGADLAIYLFNGCFGKSTSNSNAASAHSGER